MSEPVDAAALRDTAFALDGLGYPGRAAWVRAAADRLDHLERIHGRSIAERVEQVLVQFPDGDVHYGSIPRIVERILVADAYAEPRPQATS